MTAITVTVDDREVRELLAKLALVAAQRKGGQAKLNWRASIQGLI